MRVLLTALFFSIFLGTYAQSSYDLMFQLDEGSILEETRFYIENNKTIKIKPLVEDLRVYALDIEDAKTHKLAYNQLLSDPKVKHVAKADPIEWRRTIPNDPQYAEQPHMDFTRVSDVWDLTQGGETPLGDRICVAIIESGIQIDHPDLMDNIWRNEAEIPNDGLDNDQNGYVDDYYGLNIVSGDDKHIMHHHGAGVAGIVGAIGNNQQGVAGANWDVEIMILTRARNRIEIVEAYEYIRQQRIRYNETDGAEGAFVVVTNFSAGISNAWAEDFPIWCDMYDLLGQEGILNFSAATNDNSNVDETGDMPTTCTSDYLVVVTESDFGNQLTTRGYGATYVDIASPSEGLATTNIDSGYQVFGGTSGATALVTGTAALLHSMPCTYFAELYKSNPASTALLLADIILDAGTELVPEDKIIRSGKRLDAMAAAEEIIELCDFKPGELYLSVNPNLITNDEVRIEYSTENTFNHELVVSDAAGHILYEQDIQEEDIFTSTVDLDARNYSAGTYFVYLRSNKNYKVAKFIVIR